MVESINEIGHVMGKHIIAEYVESPALAEALQRIGVDYGQGYGIARPKPFDLTFEAARPGAGAARGTCPAATGAVRRLPGGEPRWAARSYRPSCPDRGL